MSTTLKYQITVPESVRRKAGFRLGEPVSFKVSDRVILIVPKLTPDEIEDEREIRDARVRAHIKRSRQEFLAGKGRPIEELFAERAARRSKRTHRKR